MKAVRAIFLGTAELARHSLQALIPSPEVSLIGVISQPDKPQGRRLRLKPTPVKTEALQHSLPVWQPASLRTDTALLKHLKNLAPDLLVAVAYGQIANYRQNDAKNTDSSKAMQEFFLEGVFGLGEDGAGDFAVDVGEAKIAAGMAEGEFFVVQAEQVKDGGVEIVHVEFVFDGHVSPFVSGAVGMAGPNAAAGQPDSESVRIVITTVVVLGERGAAEFTAPPDEGVLEKAS